MLDEFVIDLDPYKDEEDCACISVLIPLEQLCRAKDLVGLTPA